MRQAENRVKIEGILAETDLRYTSYEKNGQTVEAIGGQIKVLVHQEINGTQTTLEIPVQMFSRKYKNNGGINPSYTSIEKVMKEYVSIAAAGSEAQADKIRLTGSITMNEFLGRGGNVVSQVRIKASFVSLAVGDFKPEASFNLEFMVSSISRVTDADGVEVDPAKLKIEVIVPQYSAPDATVPNVDLVPLVATAPGVINAIENYWNAGECYKASGRLNFTSRTEEVVESVDFGEATSHARTVNVGELVVTGGSQAPLEGDFAFDMDEIKAGMAARKTRLENVKSGETAVTKKAPAQTGSKGKLDLGF
jgi:hypothetical protein